MLYNGSLVWSSEASTDDPDEAGIVIGVKSNGVKSIYVIRWPDGSIYEKSVKSVEWVEED